MPILCLVVPKLKSNTLSWTMEGRAVARQLLLVRGNVLSFSLFLPKPPEDCTSKQKKIPGLSSHLIIWYISGPVKIRKRPLLTIHAFLSGGSPHGKFGNEEDNLDELILQTRNAILYIILTEFIGSKNILSFFLQYSASTHVSYSEFSTSNFRPSSSDLTWVEYTYSCKNDTLNFAKCCTSKS